MISIFITDLTPRAKYIFNYIFTHLLGIDVHFITTFEAFQNCSGHKLCYGNQKINDELFIQSDRLLFEQGISNNQLELGKFKDLPTLFPNTNKSACLPFDLFAASFYLITRYEEYKDQPLDQHSRFQATSSIAFKNGFLRLPIINLWVAEFKKILTNQFPDLSFQSPSFKFIPSYDIDHAWAFRNKGALRNLMQLAKSIVTLNFKKTALIFSVLKNKREDPFYTFSHLKATFEANAAAPIFFFLLGQYGKYDKNVSIKSRNLQILIKQLSKKYLVGIHPSYRAHLNAQRLKSEQQILHSITQQTITNSRQHFLRLRFPETYRLLVETGITNDYTMGYADQPGFRAGIAHPFPWYDLKRESETTLTVHPFQFMDVTLRVYLQQSPEQAKATIAALISATAAVNGQLISLWHNSSLSDYDGWEGWRSVHDYIFEAVGKQA